MKQTVVLFATVALIATVASAQTTSANIVGYSKITATPGQLTLVALNFTASASSLNDLFGDLASGSSIHVWNKSTGSYVTSNKGRAGFSPNTELSLGDAFWVEAAGSSPVDIILPGEVNNAATNSATINVGIDATGYYYPVSTAFGDTDLAAALPSGSTVHFWDADNGVYQTYNKGRAGWGAGASKQIDVSEGFWIEAAAGLDWQEVRPF
jgi:hypothetical protein